MAKNVIIAITVILAIYFMTKSYFTEKVIKESAPVKYAESLRNSVKRATEKAAAANKNIMINAIEVYRVQEGAYPATLQELVPGYLRKVPVGNWKYDGNGNLEFEGMN